MRPRAAIVGTVVLDEILRAGRPALHGLGGLAYSVGALSSLAGERLEILPVCRVAADAVDRLLAAWRGLRGVQLGAVSQGPGQHTTVRLDYTRAGLAAGERSETLRHPLPPLTSAELNAAGDVDVALVNLVSGFDLQIEALEHLAARCCVYLDVHSLALARGDDGTRSPRRIADAARWLACADWVQCNASEARALVGSGDLEAGLAALLGAAGRPRCLVLTKGADGAQVFTAAGDRCSLPAPHRSDGDPTGAGDAFGAAFLAATLAGRSDIEAARQAVRAASAACSLDGAEQMGQLAAAIRCC